VIKIDPIDFVYTALLLVCVHKYMARQLQLRDPTHFFIVKLIKKTVTEIKSKNEVACSAPSTLYTTAALPRKK